jgi:hypothetical protein
LTGSLVRLEPLSTVHRAGLARAAEEDRASYAFTVVPRVNEVEAYLAAQSGRADAGELVPSPAASRTRWLDETFLIQALSGCAPYC